jgi:hypothetical protein
VDDFCNAATQSRNGTHIAEIRRASIYGVHAFFTETSTTKHVNGKEPISRSKLEKGNRNFNPRKAMIGFAFDGIKQTVCLSKEKAWRYIKEAHGLLRRKSIPLKT